MSKSEKFSAQSDEEFAMEIQEVVSPSRPIERRENLFGRDEHLTEIRRALLDPGKHVFIFGDRGIGKSSLAHTAAHEFQSSDHDPVFIVCGPTDTFSTVIRNVIKHSPKNALAQTTRRKVTGIDARFFQHTIESIEQGEHISKDFTVQEAISLIEFGFKNVSDQLVVVIDEIDVIAAQKERQLFASFIKALGDHSTKIKFIFTGVASSLDQIIGQHQSAIRQLKTIKLERLIFEYLMQIVERTFAHFDLKVDESVTIRMAAISDGYPHYVHTICKAMLWEIYDGHDPGNKVSKDLFYPSLSKAVKEVSYEIRKSYDEVTVSKSEYFKYLIWAVADSYDLERRIGHIKLSYKSLCKAIGVEPLLDTAVSSKLSLLKTPEYCAILSSVEKRKGWYKFRENMVRGYVRLCAEAAGLLINYDEWDSPDLLIRKQPHISSRHTYHDLSKYVPRVQFGQSKR